MKVSASTLRNKIQEELLKKDCLADEISVCNEDKDGNVDLAHGTSFYLMFRSELSMYRAHDLYKDHHAGCSKGFSKNLNMFYVRIGA